MTEQLIYLLLAGAILGVLPLWFALRAIGKQVASEKMGPQSPFPEKLLRPPGESLRLEIEELRATIDDQLLSFILLLNVPAFVFFFVVPVNFDASFLSLVITLPTAFFLVRKRWQKIIKLRQKLRNTQLGFDAERAVASELEALLSRGYRVFHDIVINSKPGGDETNWNIDHIAIGPNGVFVLETKGRRKAAPRKHTNLEKHQLKFDGQSLLFPDGSETADPLKQARRNCSYVKKWLSGLVQNELPCRPVVVYPGWWVITKKGKTSGVQSAKGIANRIPQFSSKRALDNHEMRTLAAVLENHCRDLEGA